MRTFFIQEFKNQPTITITQLEKDIKHRLKHNLTDRQIDICQEITPRDIKIISPFYQRKTHKPDCRCKFHKRPDRIIPKLQKSKIMTEPHEYPDTQKQKENNQSLQVRIETNNEQDQKQLEFKSWKDKLSLEQLKKLYFQYLKTLPSVEKLRRHAELDCHNPEFERYLKNQYQVTKMETKINLIQQNCTPIPSRGIRRQVTMPNGFGSYNNGRQSSNFKRIDFNSVRSSKFATDATIKTKMICFKGQLTLDQITENTSRQRASDPRKLKDDKKASFLRLVEDKEFLKQLCLKLMNQNKQANKQAYLMIKQMAGADINLFTKIIDGIRQNLNDCINIHHLDKQHSQMLVKIILKKMQSQTQSLNDSSEFDQEKRSLMAALCQQFGWTGEDNVISIKEFWRLVKGVNKGKLMIHRSLTLKPPSKMRKYQSTDELSNKKQTKIKPLYRQSELLTQKNKYSGLSRVNTLKFQDDPIEILTERFKLRRFKPMAKKGAKKINNNKEKLQSLFQQQEEAYNQSGRINKRMGTFILKYQNSDPIRFANKKQQQCEISQIRNTDKTPSFFLNEKNPVQYHIEINKKFLKRIENDLMLNDCENLVIDIGESIITKKRKIRAIRKALMIGNFQNNEQFADLMRYLDIYNEYCELVIKSKKEQLQLSLNLRKESCLYIGHRQMEQIQEKDCETLRVLLSDLQKDRELKFINFKLVNETQSQEEFMIIQPQKTPKPSEKCKIKPKQTITHKMIISSYQDESFTNTQSSIIQISLPNRVHLQNLQFTQIDTSEQPRKEIGNQRAPYSKLQRFQRTFRKIFNH